MKAYLDGGATMVREPGKRPHWSVTEWHAWFPTPPANELEGVYWRALNRYGNYVPSKDKVIDGVSHVCFYFGTHSAGGLSKIWACIQEINR